MSKKIRLTSQNAEEIFSILRKSSYAGTLVYAQAAFKKKYLVDYYVGLSIVRVQHNKKSYFFSGFRTALNGYVNAVVADNKYSTNVIWKEEGIPVSLSAKVSKKQLLSGEWAKEVEHISFPLVVKPLRATATGTGVLTNIQNQKELQQVLKKQLQTYSSVIVEEFHADLKDYRVLVLDGKVIGVLERIPASITGDGKKTIRQLIDEKNTLRKKSVDLKLGKIPFDRESQKKLESQGLSFQSILKKGRVVALRNVCNLGVGGEVRDMTNDICPENRVLARQAAATIGLRLVGLDFLCPDIRKPLIASRGVIIEANQHPDITIHHYPQYGERRDVAAKVLAALFL